jgi:hypothetical protein
MEGILQWTSLLFSYLRQQRTVTREQCITLTGNLETVVVPSDKLFFPIAHLPVSVLYRGVTFEQ